MIALLDPLTSRLTLTAYQLGWGGLRHLPEWAAYRLFQQAADLAVLQNGKGVRRLRSNYAKVRPELSRRELEHLVREGMRSYLRYFCDAFRLPDKDPDDLRRAVVVSGDAAVRAALASGRGAVVFIGHMGNVDTAGAWSALELAPVTTVAERLEPEALFQDFLTFRTRLGMTIVPLTGGVNPFGAMREALVAGGFVALPADRDLTRNGLEVDLLGHRARVAKGPAALAVATGAALFSAVIWYDDAPRGQGIAGKVVRIDFSEEIVSQADPADQVHDLTQRCVDALGVGIAAHTSSWHMLQRVFVEDLDATKAPAEAGVAT